MTPEKTFKLLPPYRYRLLDSKGHVDVIRADPQSKNLVSRLSSKVDLTGVKRSFLDSAATNDKLSNMDLIV